VAAGSTAVVDSMAVAAGSMVVVECITKAFVWAPSPSKFSRRGNMP
jgi:hypothetical protein